MIAKARGRQVMPGRGRGFVLVGVIWFLSIMTLLAAAAVLWVERSVNAMEDQRRVLQRDIEAHALLARIQWLVATQRYTAAGLTVANAAAGLDADMDASILPVGGELPLDGRELCMANGWCLALTDQAARLSLSAADPRLLGALLRGLGVPSDQVPILVAQLLDYLQPGAVPVLGSATRAPGDRSMDLVKRRSLRSVMEVFRLEAWRPWEEQLLARGWTELVVADESALNINTADPRILSLVWGLPESSLEQLLLARQERPVMQLSELRAMLGGYAGQIPDEDWVRLASSTLSIRLYPARSRQATEYDVRFSSDHRLLPPWQLLLKRSVKNVRSSTVSPAPEEVPGVLAAPFVAGAW